MNILRGKSLFIVFLAFMAGAGTARGDDCHDRLLYGLNPFLSVSMKDQYGPDPAEIVDVVLPTIGNRRTAVILIHGGGWTAADRLAFAGDATRLAEAGFTVFNINYRLGTTGQPDTYWPAQLQDAQLAVRWARKYAGQFDFDPQRICAVGASAGAQMAMYLGYLHESQPGDRAGLEAQWSPHVNCVVDISGPANLTNPLIVPSISGLPVWGTSDPLQLMKVLVSASPIFAIDSHSAPTLVIQGKDDTLVPVPMAQELVNALEDNYVPVVYREVDGGHVFIGTPADQQQAARNLMYQFIAKFAGN